MEKQKNIPQLRFPEFEGEWVRKRFGDISEIIMGQSPDSKSYNFEGDGEFLIQGNADIFERKSNPRQWTNEPTKRCQVGDILFTVRAPVGYVAKSVHNACIGRGVCSIRNTADSEQNFLYQFLLSYELKWKRIEQGSTFTTVSGADIKKIEIKIPLLSEQQKIASFFTSIDQKIFQLKRKRTLLERYKKGVMQKIFSQEIRFKDDNGQEFPMWEKMRLGSFLVQKIREVLKPDKNYSAIGVRSHCKGTFQRVDSDPNKIEMDNLYMVKKDDLVVNITFAWEGAIAIAKAEDDGGLVSHRFPTYVFDEEKVLGMYFRYVFIQKKFRELLELISPGGAGRNRVLNKQDFLKLTCDAPNIEEQTKIANFLSAIDEKINHTLKQINKAEVWKKGLMQQMFV